MGGHIFSLGGGADPLPPPVEPPLMIYNVGPIILRCVGISERKRRLSEQSGSNLSKTKIIICLFTMKV